MVEANSQTRFHSNNNTTSNSRNGCENDSNNNTGNRELNFKRYDLKSTTEDEMGQYGRVELDDMRVDISKLNRDLAPYDEEDYTVTTKNGENDSYNHRSKPPKQTNPYSKSNYPTERNMATTVNSNYNNRRADFSSHNGISSVPSSNKYKNPASNFTNDGNTKKDQLKLRVPSNDDYVQPRNSRYNNKQRQPYQQSRKKYPSNARSLDISQIRNSSENNNTVQNSAHIKNHDLEVSVEELQSTTSCKETNPVSELSNDFVKLNLDAPEFDLEEHTKIMQNSAKSENTLSTTRQSGHSHYQHGTKYQHSNHYQGRTQSYHHGLQQPHYYPNQYQQQMHAMAVPGGAVPVIAYPQQLMSPNGAMGPQVIVLPSTSQMAYGVSGGPEILPSNYMAMGEYPNAVQYGGGRMNYGHYNHSQNHHHHHHQMSHGHHHQNHYSGYHSYGNSNYSGRRPRYQNNDHHSSNENSNFGGERSSNKYYYNRQGYQKLQDSNNNVALTANEDIGNEEAKGLV